MNEQGTLCVFAKHPRVGGVKTRLVPLVGNAGAAALAEAFLQDTWSAVSSLSWTKAVIASTGLSIAPVVSGNAEVWLQGEGDLGARLERIMRRAFEFSPFAVALGADSPGLPLRFLEQARSALHSVDAVIGPCEDGRFYLLGLRQCPSGLLCGIPWSQTNTFARTVARLRAAGLDVYILDRWFDVDRPEDLARLQAMMTAGELQAPRTKDVLGRFLKGEVTGNGIKISVIIPVLNEREFLPKALADLQTQEWVHEVILVDGGSTDGTFEWLNGHTNGNVKVVRSQRGRGTQLNAGAAAAAGDIFLFLHVDCLLPGDAGEGLKRALAAEDAAGGCFCARFMPQRPRSLALVAAGINVRTRIAHSATGDQAIFVRGSVFEQLGGFREWPLFEDVDFVNRMKRVGRFIVLPSLVTVSARRHIRYGVFRTVLLAYILRLGFWAGISPFTLSRWYQAQSGSSKPQGIHVTAAERRVISG